MRSERTHPDEIFKALTVSSVRQQKRDNLKILHELCRVQHNGGKDFSIATIGKLWELAGGISARALYNAPSEDYRTLIKAWESFSGPLQLKPNRPSTNKYQFLERIDDAAVRALVQGIIIERDKMRAELNLLKSGICIELDRRPVNPSRSNSDSVDQSRASSLALSESEREALGRSISPAFLRDEGWTEGRNGEVYTDKGRRLFEAGFVQAIKKILDGSTRPD
ncbi:MAG: alpha/beta hydrolase [Alphaproteobacteria bacterium]|nr:MAG: alpha/beta hydrolase [Alphaproteobacteria bacterium]